MAKSKKSRRPSASGATPRSYGEIYKNSTTLPDAQVTQPAPSTAVAAAASVPASKTVDLGTEYAFVRKDMRDLAWVALAVFVGMLAVGFVLSYIS